ncbi:plasmolipin isoform X3 [Rhinatrema bivittatum]|nr:plasmolipin isoform X3 [Rhinatrema bivittatum]
MVTRTAYGAQGMIAPVRACGPRQSGGSENDATSPARVPAQRSVTARKRLLLHVDRGRGWNAVDLPCDLARDQVLGLLVWALIADSHYYNWGAYHWVMFVAVFCWLLTIIFLVIYLLQLHLKLHVIPWAIVNLEISGGLRVKPILLTTEEDVCHKRSPSHWLLRAEPHLRLKMTEALSVCDLEPVCLSDASDVQSGSNHPVHYRLHNMCSFRVSYI